MKTLIAITPDTKDIPYVKRFLNGKEFFENRKENTFFFFEEELNANELKALAKYEPVNVVEAFTQKEKGLKHKGLYVEIRARKEFLYWYIENYFYDDLDFAREILTKDNVYEFFKSLNEFCVSWYVERRLPIEHPFFFLYTLLNTKEFENFMNKNKLGYPLNYRLFRKKVIECKPF